MKSIKLNLKQMKKIRTVRIEDSEIDKRSQQYLNDIQPIIKQITEVYATSIPKIVIHPNDNKVVITHNDNVNTAVDKLYKLIDKRRMLFLEYDNLNK